MMFKIDKSKNLYYKQQPNVLKKQYNLLLNGLSYPLQIWNTVTIVASKVSSLRGSTHCFAVVFIQDEEQQLSRTTAALIHWSQTELE